MDCPLCGFELEKGYCGMCDKMIGRKFDGKMPVTDHECAEWSRLARAAYAADRNDIGHRYSVAAAVWQGKRMPIGQWDALQSGYRGWLVFGTWPKSDSSDASYRPMCKGCGGSGWATAYDTMVRCETCQGIGGSGQI